MTNRKKVINTIIVEPDLSLKERILAGGYNWVNYLLSESGFPDRATFVGEWAFRFVHLNKNIKFDNAVRLSVCDGWEVANLAHLLSFGEQFPEKQREFPIVALGSIFKIQGSSDVPILLSHNSQRILTLHSKNYDFGHDIHFLSVHKIFKV